MTPLAVAPRTPARPGPGRVPETALRALDIHVRRRIDGVLTGDHRAVSLGGALELAQIRPYQPGDDVRMIDWNTTARMAEPHVRQHVAERALSTWILLDGSASMGFGTDVRRKADVAEGVVLAVGHVATRRGNRLGLITFGAGESIVVPPRQGRHGLIGVLLRLQDAAAQGENDGAGATSVGEVLARAAHLVRQRSLLVVVSDLRGPRDWERSLRELCVRHDVIVVEVRDRAEESLPDLGELTLVDPETGTQLRVDTSRRHLRERYATAAAAERAATLAAVHAAGADHLVLTTGDDWLRPLVAGLSNRPFRR